MELSDVSTDALNDAVKQAVQQLSNREELLLKAQKLKDVERKNIQEVAQLLNLSQQ